MQVISGYQFVHLSALTSLKETLFALCTRLNLHGTILLSSEGINLSLAGSDSSIATFELRLREHTLLRQLELQKTSAVQQPFKRLKIKIKPEIITMRAPITDPSTSAAPYIKPKELHHWIKTAKDFVLLDTRNDYELALGSFEGASHLNLKHFSEFPDNIQQLDNRKVIVTYCTGGIRCEKAALYLLEHGFNPVFQLKGGILNYFREVGKEYFNGECFVFDNRISISD